MALQKPFDLAAVFDGPSITHLLNSWSDGEEGALEQVVTLVYRELWNIGAAYLKRESPHHSLQPTALINEVFLKLIGGNKATFENRLRFYAFSAQIMRRTLIDHARRRKSKKKGGDCFRVTFNEEIADSKVRNMDPDTLLAFEEALNDLKAIDPIKKSIVEMRFFAGLDFAEIAEVLALSSRTVRRKWQTASRWLAVHLNDAKAIDNPQAKDCENTSPTE